MIIVGLAFGTMEICNTDYLEVYDAFLGVNDALDSRRLITRFCGSVSIFLIKNSSAYPAIIFGTLVLINR